MNGYVFAVAAAVLFSSKSILIKLAYAAGSNAEALLALRMLIALPIYLSVWLVHRMRRPGVSVTWRATLASAAIGVLGYGVSSYLDMKGLEYVSAPIERLILFTYPFFVAVLGAWFFGLRLQRGAFVGLFISYTGLALVLYDSWTGPVVVGAIGVGLVFGAAVTFALFQLLAGRAVRSVGAVTFTCISMSAAAVCSIAAFLLGGSDDKWFCSAEVLTYGALLALLGTVLPSFLLAAALKRISPQANSAIGAVSPIFTILLSMVVLGDVLGLLALAGSVLVIAGAAWFTCKES